MLLCTSQARRAILQRNPETMLQSGFIKMLYILKSIFDIKI